MIETNYANSQTYVLGHSTSELDRLVEQSRFYGDLTAHVLHLAGLRQGMRVLDAGCGTGDVSFLAASIVGPQGSVVGVDKSQEATDFATQRATAAGLSNIEFVAQDLNDLELDKPVDALIGRLVLMYFPDPAVVLRRLATQVRAGGIVAFHELDGKGATAEPSSPLFEATVQWITDSFVRAGIDLRVGLKLGRIYQEAGLPAPKMIQGARVERGPDSAIYEQLAQLTRTLLPLMERTGIATAEEVDIDSLAERLRLEAVSLEATLVPPPFIGAWAQKG